MDGKTSDFIHAMKDQRILPCHYRGKAKYLIEGILDPVLAAFKFWFFVVTKKYFCFNNNNINKLIN